MKNLWRRFLVLVLIISMLSSNMMSISFASTNQEEKISLYDIEEENNINMPEDIRGHWAEKEMSEMFAKGYFKGYKDGLSHPEYNITRAQVVTMINSLLALSDYTAGDTGEDFTDIEESDWFYKNVMIAKENGYILGYNDMTFRPNQEMTRYEITQLLSRLLQDKEIDEVNMFTDEEDFPSWVKSAMENVKAFNIFTGYEDGSFKGSNTMTRGEWFAVLYRCEDYIKSAIESEETIDTASNTSKKKNNSKTYEVELVSMTPDKGQIGTEIEITGLNITSNNDELKVYFDGSKSGLKEVSYTSNFNNKITLFAEFMEIESYQVYIVSEGNKSNTLTFNAELFNVEVNPLAAPEFVEAVEKLNAGVKHEIGVVFSDQAFFDALPSEDKDALQEINKAVEDLSKELQLMLTNYEGLSNEGKQLLNTLMSTSLFAQTSEDLDAATELLSHSSTSEALDNIHTATIAIREVRDKMEWVKTTLEAFIVSVEAGAILGDIFGFGAGVSLHAIAAAASEVLTTVVKPILTVLNIIIFLLDIMPSNAVKDSFETEIFTNNIGIDENFGSIREILGDQRADNILERDLATLLAYSIRTTTELNMVFEHKIQGINYGATSSIDFVVNNSTIEEDLARMIEKTQDLIATAYEDPEYFYEHRADYDDYLNDMDDLIVTSNDFLTELMQRYVETQAIFGGDFIVEINKIKSTAVYGLELSINNLRYTFEKNYDPILFRQAELESAVVDEAGIIYIDKAVNIKGTMDFSGQTNTQMIFEHGTNRMMVEAGVSPLGSIESLITGAVADFMFSLVDKFIDLDIDLDDVEVKLSFESSDESILSGYWDGESIILTGHRPGMVETVIRADIEQVRNGEIEEEYAMIKRNFLVISGEQINEPYSQGPRIDTILNEEGEEIVSAYIGDILTIEGRGFSLLPSRYQNLYFGSLPIYNELGLTEFMYQPGYNSFKAEVPDALGDDIKVIVGPDQDKTPSQMDKWPSNIEYFKLLPTELHNVHPTGIVGESWPVMGRGFSHYPLRNEGIFNGLQDYPGIEPQSFKGLFNTASQNTLNHNYHNKLDFVFSEQAEDGTFKIMTDGVYETESYPYTAHEFAPILKLNGDNEGIRPSYVIDEDNGDGIAVWYDINDSGGMQLISAFANRQENSFNEFALISDNIGGILTAPDELGIDCNGGVYGVAWIGRGDTGNDVFISESIDGKNWTEAINVSSSPNASSSPELAIGDIDDDGDQDIIAVWTENSLVESDSSEVKMATLINDNGSYMVKNSLVSNRNASEVSMDMYDNYLALSWSEETTDPYSKNIKGLFASYEDGELINEKIFTASENSGYTSYASYEDELKRLKTYKTAGYSDLAIGMDEETNEPNIYIAWENYDKSTKDGVEFRNTDVFFRVVPAEGNMGEIQNITNSIKSSQTPKVTVDGDDTPTISFIETGYEDHKYFRDQGFETEVYFARSFDNGQSFNKPFIKVDSNQDAQRIGHIQIDGASAADYGLIYQYESEGKQEIRFYSTQEIDTVEENTIENTLVQKNDKFIMRTYSSDSYSGSLLNTNEHPYGDVFISKEDNSDLMRIIRNNSVSGNISASPDGKYISYGQEYLMVAEADGSHPIGIYIGEWESTALDAMWSPSGNYIAFRGIGEMAGYDDGKGGVRYVDRNGLKFGGVSDLNLSSASPWGYIDDTEVFVVKPKDDWFGDGIMIIDPRVDDHSFTDDDILKSWPSITLDGKYMALVEINTRDPYDYGKLYLKNMETGINKLMSTSGALPVFSPDSKYMAYNIISEGKRSIKIRGLYDTDFNILVSTDSNLYQPVFNSDSSKLYFNEKNASTGAVVLKYYDVVQGQVYTIGTSSGVSGKADLLTVSTDLLVKDDKILLKEGEDTSLEMRLSKMPEHEVSVQVVALSSSLDINQENFVFDASNWNTYQNIVISSVEDNEDNGDKIYEIRFIISSQDDYFENGSSISTQVYYSDNDGVDTISPEWEEESHVNLEAYGNTQLKATWPKGKDNVGVTGYRVILKDGDQKEIYNDIVSDQVFISETLLPTITYTLKVYALDDMYNSSDELSAFYTPADVSSPYFNSEDIISIEYLSNNEIEITWDQAHDDTVINRYNIYLDEVLIGSASERRYTKTGLDSDTRYTISVRPVDSSDNIGGRIGMTFTTLREDAFEQGLGYYDGRYLHGAIHPTYNQWNGSSRFTDPTDMGLSFVLEDYKTTSPVIDEDGNIYTTNALNQLSKLDKDGNIIWVNEFAIVDGDITLHQDHIYFVDSGGGISICNYSSGGKLSRYITADYIAKEIMGIDRDNNLILRVIQNNNLDCVLLVGVDFEASTQFNIIRRIPFFWDIENYVLGDDGWLYFVDISSNFLGYDLYSPNDTYHYGDGHYKERSIDNKLIEEPSVSLSITKMLSGTNESRDLFLFQKNYEYGSRRFISAFDTEGVFSIDEGMDINEIKWQTEINGTLTSNQITQTDDGKLIASGYNGFNGYVVCIDTSSGELLWDTTIEGAVFNNKRALVNQSNSIYILDDNGRLFKLNMNGEVVFERRVVVGNDENFSMPIIGNNAMYMTHNGLVKLDDSQGGEFSVSEYTKIYEGANVPIASIPVKLEGNDNGVRYVHYKTENLDELGYDAAQSDGIDYEASEGYLRFDKGETIKYVKVTIHDDTNNETYEPFKLIIDEAIGGSTLKENEDTMIVGIRDDDYQNPLGFTITSQVVDEADGSVVLTVQRNDDAFLKACSVEYRIESEGTPEEYGYIDSYGTLDFEKGDIEKSIVIVLVNDDEYIPGRSFTVVLENPKLVDINHVYKNLTVEISDSDNLTGVEFDQSSNIEDVEEAITYSFNIERENTSGSSILLEASGTATYGVDYTSNIDLSKIATIAFEDEELIKTLTISMIDDDEAETKETLHLELLKGKATDLEPGSNKGFDISIVDDDAVTLAAPIANVSKNGSESVTFYDLIVGAELNVYDANDTVVKTVNSVYDVSQYVHIGQTGDGFYGIQRVGVNESNPSNTFSVSDVAREAMIIDPDFSEVYTFTMGELVEHYDGYDLEYTIIHVDQTLPDNRKIFYVQTYMPFEVKDGGVLADLMGMGFAVSPDWENYSNEGKLEKAYMPESKIYYYVTTGTEVLSDIIYYGVVQ